MADDLTDLRASLDKLDNELVSLLAERFRVTHEVGLYKKQHNLPPVDEVREAAQYARIEALARTAGLDPGVARKVLQLIIGEVRKNHRRLQSEK